MSCKAYFTANCVKGKKVLLAMYNGTERCLTSLGEVGFPIESGSLNKALVGLES